MEESRRLKRGLKDISPLFEIAEKANPPALLGSGQGGFQCLSVFSPDFPGDSLFLNACIASRIAASDHACSILSIASRAQLSPAPSASRIFRNESYGSQIRRFILSWDQLETVWHSSVPRGIVPSSSLQFLFLDFEYFHPLYFQRLVPILDQGIIFVQPTIESLTEAYKMIKATVSLNPRLEYSLLFDGSPADPRGSILFEGFSEIVAKMLGISLVWLGSLHLPRHTESLDTGLALDPLFLKRFEKMESVEKISLAALLQSSLQAPADVTR